RPARARGRHPVGRADPRQPHRPGRHLRRLPAVDRRAGAAEGDPGPVLRAAHVLRQQVVLRRGDRLPVRPAHRVARALREQHVRAGVRQRRAGRRVERRGARAVGHRARAAVGLPALLRRAAANRAHRPERLLPVLPMRVSLTILIFFPIVLGLLASMSPPNIAAWVSLLGTLVPLIYAMIMIADFKTGTVGLQHATDKSWIPELGIRYKIGVDGLNVWL